MTVLWLGNDPIPDQWHGAQQSLVSVLSDVRSESARIANVALHVGVAFCD